MDGAAQGDDNIDALPLEQRLGHKVWKARLSAYTEIASVVSKTVDESDPVFREYYFLTQGSAIREWVRDANAVAQEKGVEAACAVVEFGGRAAARSRPDVVPSVVEKCLGSARAGTRTKGIELCLLYIEGEEDMAEGVIGDVTPGLDAKQPKVVAGTVMVLKEAVRCFGPKTVNVKQILKTLPKIFAHADKTVRSEGQLLALALHSYLGPALTPHLADLKPVQQKELGEAFEAADRGEKGDEFGFGKVRPCRFTASHKKAMAVQEAQGQLERNAPAHGGDDEGADEPSASSAAGADDAPEAAIDPYDLAEPIPLLSQLPDDFYTHLSSSKWKDRKELALEPLLATLSSSLRYQPDNYADLVAALAGRMADANVLCVVLAAQCIEKLARGLRGEFARYKGAVTAPILGKTKEKKQNVQDALGAALDAVAVSTLIGDFTEDVTTFAKDKNPSVKAATLAFYTRCLCSTSNPPPKGDLPDLIEAMKKALEDSDAGVRAAAADALGTLLKVVGDRTFNALAGEMDPLRKEKVTEAAEKAVTKCKNGVGAAAAGKSRPPGGAAPAPARAPASMATGAPAPKPRPRPGPPANKENAPPARLAASSGFDEHPPPPKPAAPKGPPARLLASKPAAAAAPPSRPTPAAAPAGKSAPSRPAPAAASGSAKAAEPLRFRHSQEAAESMVDDGGVFPPEIVAQLNDANWKQRLEGMEKLSEWVKLDGVDADAEVLVRYLTGKKPGAKESNFQVAGKVFALLTQLAAESPNWSKAPMAVSIPVLCDKFGDIKLKKPASDALTAFAEKSSLGFVLAQAYEPMSKQKAPKTLAESYAFVEQALRDFGLAGGLAVRDLIEFLKVGLKHSNAAVRTAATKTLVTLRLFVGADVVSFLSDLSPQLLSTIESEFEKVASESAPEPTRVGADTVVAAPRAPAAGSAPARPGRGGAAAAAASEPDPLDELYPRVDFDRLVSSAQIQALGDSAWKVRKEAIEGIRDALDANKRIKPTTLPELATPLKQRITDANKIIQIIALDIVAKLASGMGAPFGQNLSRTFAGAVAQVLSDQKANIRAAAVTTLTAMADAAGLDGLVGAFDKPLEGNNPVQRKELLAWLEARMQDPEAAADVELGGLAAGLLACLEDKQAEVRKSATALLPVVIARAGYGVVADSLAKLKPASRSTALPIVENARAAAYKLGSAAPPAPVQTSGPSRPSSSAAATRPAASGPARPPPTRPVPATSAPAAAPSAAPISAPPAAAPPARAPAGLSRPAAKPLRTLAPAAAEEAPPSAVPSRLGQPRSRQSISGLRSAAASSRPMSSASNVSSAASSREPPFRSSDPNQKLLRHKKETGAMRWVIEGTPRQDQVDWLAGQMAAQVSSSLHAQLFSTDHSAERDYLAGLSVIDDCAREPATAGEACDLSEEEMRDRLVANFDLIVKYITLRLALTSTVITIKCLDLIDHLLPVLSRAEYRASDYEALPLLISLVSKVGDSKETIRLRVRAIFKSICSTYPFSKVFSTIFEHGLDNKNARVRSECIEELGQLYSRHGAKIYPISQALPKIASNIGKPDANTRTSALHAIGAVYTLVGPDATWKAVGNLPAKDRSMLEERLKRTASGAASPMPPARTSSHMDAPPGTPGGLRPPASRLAAPASPSPANGTSAAAQARPGIPRPGGIPSRLARPQMGAAPSAGPATVRSNMPPPIRPSGVGAARTAKAPVSAAFTEDDLMAEMASDIVSLIDSLDTDDFNACSDVLKLVTREITKNSEQVLLHVDPLVDAITARMELGFTNLAVETSPAQLRLCKHLMQVLSALFDKRPLSQQVSRLPLTGLLADLTGRLLDTADNPASEPIQSLSKVLNMVLIRIFHNADQNVCFGALLTVLQDATIDLRELHGEELADRAKYAELVMKCLWKVSKTVKESLESQQLQPPRLLSDINQFLITIPPAEWRRRATDNIPLADMPLRTVKTILQQIVSVMKEKVFNELDEIDQAENSFVYQYLYRLANQLSGGETALRAEALARKASASSLGSVKRDGSAARPASSASSSPPAATKQSAVLPPSNAPPAASPGGTDIAVNQRLKEIFDLIGDPSQSRAGIAALYEFQKDHPEASARIATWMAGTGSYFQTYLKRALANLEAADRERTLEMPMDGSPEASRPSSGASRPSSAVPGTPTRSSRASLAPNVSSTPKLQELRSMFGLTDKEAH